MSCLLAAPSPARTAQAPLASSAAPAVGGDVRYTLDQLGTLYPINLRGVDGSDSFEFGVRDDQVVTAARLKLTYAYSPSLLPELSHINVLVNDQVAASIPLPKETGGASLKRTVDLPPYLITPFSVLRLQLIGHYTMQCEDPLHSSLWANISLGSELDLATAPLPMPNDLARLPEPFFDAHDRRLLALPFVFAGNPDEAALEAAGTVSSWFGALAGYRGARFPVSIAQIPAQGNAVVLAAGAQAAALAPAPLQGPTLAVVDNPNDPNGKLLLVMGRDGKELKQAAAALAIGNQALSGASATITQLADQAPRKPYDAPRWLRTDRPVSFGELIDAKRMNVSGFNPGAIRIDVRVPPDLFGWHEPKVPVDLRYRYTPQQTLTNSALLFHVNDQFVKSIPLPSLERLADGGALRAQVLPDSSLPMRAQVEVPLQLLKSRAQLQLRYMYDYLKQGECRDIIIDNVRGAIDPESTIDLTGYPHFMAMPDLAAFAQAGFPFTRLADLSETAVVLGANAGPQEYSVYLFAMGRMGESTGYPTTGVTVVRARTADAAPSGKDLLVIASGADPAWRDAWAGQMPAGYGRDAYFTLSDLPHRVLGWFHADPRLDDEPHRAALAYAGNGVSAVVAGFESPRDSGRSVVMLASNRPEGLQDVASALLGGPDYNRPIQGSLTVIRGKEIDPLVGEQTYYIGHLGFFKRIAWTLSPFMPRGRTLTAAGWVLAVIVALLLLGWLASWLWRRRRARFGQAG